MNSKMVESTSEDNEQQQHDWCQKSTSEAVKLRNLGNCSYNLKQYNEALKYYSQSVAAAPTGSTELALAYGNRSAVLFFQRKHELCILDVNRALQGLHIPKDSEKTLIKRKQKCWERLNEEVH